MRIGLTALVVHDYDEAIRFFVDAVGFTLITDDDMGEGKRWVVVAPPGADGGLLLARAVNDEQSAAIGRQAGGRVGHFLFTDDFDGQYARMLAGGVTFLEAVRSEPYGKVVVWQDLCGNRWDLLEDRG